MFSSNVVYSKIEVCRGLPDGYFKIFVNIKRLEDYVF